MQLSGRIINSLNADDRCYDNLSDSCKGTCWLAGSSKSPIKYKQTPSVIHTIQCIRFIEVSNFYRQMKVIHYSFHVVNRNLIDLHIAKFHCCTSISPSCASRFQFVYRLNYTIHNVFFFCLSFDYFQLLFRVCRFEIERNIVTSLFRMCVNFQSILFFVALALSVSRTECELLPICVFHSSSLRTSSDCSTSLLSNRVTSSSISCLFRFDTLFARQQYHFPPVRCGSLHQNRF